MRIDEIEIGAEYAWETAVGPVGRVRADEITPAVLTPSGSREPMVRITELDTETGAPLPPESSYTGCCRPARELSGSWAEHAEQAADERTAEHPEPVGYISRAALESMRAGRDRQATCLRSTEGWEASRIEFVPLYEHPAPALPSCAQPLAVAKFDRRRTPPVGPEYVVLRVYEGHENLHIDGEYAVYRRTAQAPDVEEIERLREALQHIADGAECETYTGPPWCRDPRSGRTRDAEYTADRWCDTCIAREALGSASLTKGHRDTGAGQ